MKKKKIKLSEKEKIILIKEKEKLKALKTLDLLYQMIKIIK